MDHRALARSRARSGLALALAAAIPAWPARAPAAGPGSAPGTASPQVFVPFRHVDPVTGLEALRALVPKGWRVEGHIDWAPDPALPASARFRFWDPSSGAELNLFPAQAFFWTNNALFLRTNPPGTLRFNTRVARPLGLDEAMTRLVLGTYRKGVAALSMGERAAVPELARLARGEAAKGVRTSADAGRVRVSYTDGGRAWDEELFAAVSQVVIDVPASPPYWIEYWYVDHVFALRAPRGRLEAHAGELQTVLHSLKVDKRWFAKVVNTREALVRTMTQGIREMGRIGATAAAASSSLRDDQLKDWERRQAAQDRVAQAQSDTIRGVQRFHDPHADKEVELPNGYGMAWANNLGEYVVTNDPGFNPNVGSNLHWEPMPAAR